MRNIKGGGMFWITLCLLAGSDNGESLLPDPMIEDSSLSSTSSRSFEGATAEARAAVGCHFPEAWSGSWFQSGIHHKITIRQNLISTKGRCLEKDGEKYLVFNERDSCYRCLVFSEKHLNVLQYKETFCIQERRSLRNICSTITGDANLFAMFRVEATPVDCPFKGQFRISYNRGHGECHYPVSSLDSCTKSSRLVFNYQACPDVPGTESSVEELQCLASWKEGSSRYFLGLIQYQHHASYEERFRCFVYERSKRTDLFGSNPTNYNSHSSKFHGPHQQHHPHRNHHIPAALSSSSSRGYMSDSNNNNNGNANGGNNGSSSSSEGPEQIYRVAQSGDATCNGLSSMEGARTMTLKRAPAPKPCQFPSWIVESPHWHTLDQGSTYSFHEGNLRISNFSELAGTGPNSLAMNALCYQLLERRFQGEKNLILLHATADCKSGFICAAFYRRNSIIMEIQFGSMARRAEDACHLSHFDPAHQPYVTLVSSTPQKVECPHYGHYQVNGVAWNGRKIPDSCDQTTTNGEDNIGINQVVKTTTSRTSSPDKNNGKYLSVGCSRKNTIRVRVDSQCEPREFIAEHSCNGWWVSNGITYVVTTRSSSKQSLRPQKHCFAFRDLSTSLESLSQNNPNHQQKRKRNNLHSYTDSLETSFSSYDHYNDNEDRDEPDPSPEEDRIASQDLRTSSTSNSNNYYGQVLAFSSFADSCRRNVVLGLEGDFAFNLTNTGECSDMSSAASAPAGRYQLPRGPFFHKHLLSVAFPTTAAVTLLLLLPVVWTKYLLVDFS